MPAPEYPSPLEATLIGKAQQMTDPKYAAWRAQYPKITDTNDYDVYRAYQEGAVPDPATGHLDDIGKLPNHITYSTDSWASKQKGAPTAGSWIQGPDQSWQFHASEWNVSNAGGKDALKAYFSHSEPGNTVVFPDGEVFTAPPLPAQGPRP